MDGIDSTSGPAGPMELLDRERPPFWPWLALAAVALSAAAGGCAPLEVGYEGRALAAPLPLWRDGAAPAAGTAGGSAGRPAEPPFAWLVADGEGNLALGDERLEVGLAREDARLGVVLADLAEVPRAWRPAYARDGGVLVTAIESGSPLALAGLRPFDVLHGVNGEAVRGAADALARLLGPAAGEAIDLDVTRRFAQGDAVPTSPRDLLDERRVVPAGARHRVDPDRAPMLDQRVAAGFDPRAGRPARARLRARAVERIADGDGLYLPLLVEARWARDGVAVGAGPLDLLFHVRKDRDAWLRDEDTLGEVDGETVGYADHLDWGALLGLVRYRRARLVEGGAEACELRLFWLLPIRWESGPAGAGEGGA